MPIRRVLMTVDAETWAPTISLARQLCGRGIATAVLGLGDLPSRIGEDLGGRLTLHRQPGRLEWMDDPWDDVAAAGEMLRELCREFRPDVVHVNGFAHAGLSLGCPIVIAAHGCVLSWHEAVHDEAPPRERYAVEVGRGLSSARVLVTPTRAMLDSLRWHYSDLPAAGVIPYAAEPAPRTERLPVSMISTARAVWDDGTGPAMVERMAERLGCALQAPGAPPSGVFVQVPRYEPGGFAALQAGRMGCALVLSDLPSFREIWGEAACYVDPDDEQAVVDVTDALLSVEALRFEMGKRATARARRFTRARMVDGWLAAYRAALAVPSAVASAEEVSGARGDVLPFARFRLESP